MTPLRTRLISAVVTAVMVLALTASVAAAGTGATRPESVPYDPGFPDDLVPSLPLRALTE